MTAPARRQLNSRQIEVFRAVMVTGSVTAARQLRVAQPSLSRTMKRVEDLVGFPLFERAKGRLLPTAEARQLVASVEHIQAQIDGLGDVIEQIGKGGTGLFRFGASPSLARQLMPMCLAGLRGRFPEVRIHFDVMPLSDIVDYLALGIGECFFSMTPILHPVVGCAAVGPGRLVCLLPASHPLARRRELSAKDLIGLPLIMCEPGSPHGRLVQALFQEVGAEPNVAVTARFAELAIELTGAGLGVTVVDEFTALKAASDAVAVRPLDGPPRFAAGSGVGDLSPGRGVVLIPSVTCGVCPSCRAGDFDACLDRSGIGMTRGGGFARRVLAPARNCLKLPAGFDPAVAALCEPLAIGARAVEVGGVREGDRVLVMGPDTIGQAIALMARAAGAAEVVAVGADDGMRLGVLHALGFERTADVAQRPLADAAGVGKCDVAFEATGAPSVVQQGLALLRREGVLVVAGIHPRPATIDLNGLVREQQQLRGTQRGKRRNWLAAAVFLAEQGGRLAPMITRSLPLGRALEGFEMARLKQASKVMVLPAEASRPRKS